MSVFLMNSVVLISIFSEQCQDEQYFLVILVALIS